MKNTYLYLVGAALALVIAGCAKSSGGSSGTPAAAATNSVCPVGLLNTQYGCLSQGNCPVGQAQYNNGQCVAATSNQCASGTVYSSQVGTCIPQGNCPVGQGLYNNQCIIADGYNNGFNNFNNGNFTPGINGGFNNCISCGFNSGANTGFNAGFNYQFSAGYNPYIPQQNYYYYSNPFTNPCWTPQYYYGW
jgi:hypothetical protein